MRQVSCSMMSLQKPDCLPALEPSKSEYPLSPLIALEHFASQLSDYERSEILDYKQIYCLGLGTKKIEADNALRNGGFDDDRGDYNIIIGDHIAYRFEVVSSLGKGSFGKVLRCFDHKRKESIALKILRNKKRFHQQGVIEVKVLETMKENDPNDTMNVVRMKMHFRFRKHLCLVFELLNMNLYDFLKANEFRGFSLSLIRKFAVQLLTCLKFLKDSKIIHCDLKPENVLLKQINKSVIKVIDFGSACFEEARLYTYIQSRFYRAPEVILGAPYSSAIDMWSLACMLTELHTGSPLFHGENESEQLQCIMEVLGRPPPRLLAVSSRKDLFFEANNEPKLTLSSKGLMHYPGMASLEKILEGVDEVFLDFLKGCLEWDPKLRTTPEEGLAHDWIRDE